MSDTSAPEAKPAPASNRGQLISTTVAAQLLMLDPERIRQLSKEGWIEKGPKDNAGGFQFHLLDVVQGYIRFLRDENRKTSRTASETRMRDAKVREVELRTAQREGLLIDYAEHMADIEELCGMMRSEFSGLASRVTRDLQFRNTIETAINDIFAKIADAAAKKARDVDADREPSSSIQNSNA